VRSVITSGLGATNGVGPELNGLDDRHSGSVPSYSYSDANKNSGIVWNEQTFEDYIKDPKAKIPGTKMIFAGIKNEQQAKGPVGIPEAVRCPGQH
jgi:cytochrome c